VRGSTKVASANIAPYPSAAMTPTTASNFIKLGMLHLSGPLNALRGDYDHLRSAVARAIFARGRAGRGCVERC
jgi:hypothetical protein